MSITSWIVCGLVLLVGNLLYTLPIISAYFTMRDERSTDVPLSKEEKQRRIANWEARQKQKKEARAVRR